MKYREVLQCATGFAGINEHVWSLLPTEKLPSPKTEAADTKQSRGDRTNSPGLFLSSLL